MKIIHVSDTSIFNYDGIATYINELVSCGLESGDTVKVMIPPPLYAKVRRKVLHTADLMVYRKFNILSSDKFVFAWPKNMKQAMEEFKPDLVWIHTIGPLGLTAARLCKNRYPGLYTKHCFDGELWCNHLQIDFRFHRPFHWLAAKIESWVLGPIKGAVYHFRDLNKIQNPGFCYKFEFFPPPLNKRFLLPGPSSRPRESDSVLTLGFCGRLDPEKGLAAVFEGIEIYQKAYARKKIKLLLIGDGPNGQGLAKAYPQVDTTITGFVDDVIPYLDQLDVFVLASKTETTSLSSLEAYARRLPVFTRPVGFLGLNPNQYSNVETFNTSAELAILLHDFIEAHLILNQKGITKEFDESLITFGQLYTWVTQKYS